MNGLEDRLAGGLFGLLVGDALGVPYEFTHPDEIPERRLIEMSPPSDFHRSHRNVPPGTWSDDGAQALCLLESLLERDRFDLDDFSKRLVAWYERGHMAVDGRVFDVGVQTSTALRALMAGLSPLEAGPAEERHNGNGSLMRVLPLALWHRGPDEELVHDAYLQSHVTHAHARSRVCCALYCLWARRTLTNHAAPWDDAVATIRRIIEPDSVEAEALEFHIRPDDRELVGEGSGYVVDTLRSARMVLEAGSYEASVRAAIALGNDTDTTACVAGGIVGLRDGYEAIPQRWREALRGRELAAPLLERLVSRHTR
ncbi:MAG TPA: ADP-ribosylglycohydrolase family protein [Labilithrix sp.]|nr:ADP-ribosylglycohydrolase family protein [Labilithrix sp.]